MKKILNKVLRRKRPSSSQSEHSSLRITNETVAEHRERILAGGRKFKYPLQYPRHRVVLITAGLVAIVLLVIGGITAWRLYSAQDTDKLLYSVTKILPIPVASIDGRDVRYSDYLLGLRSALHYLSTKEAVNFASDDGRRQLDYQKRLALSKAIEHAYAQRIADEHHITVADKELDEFIRQQIKNNQLGVTEDMYRRVIEDYYDWTMDDYRYLVGQQLLSKKVLAKIDIEGRDKASRLLQELVKGKDFTELAKAESEDPIAKSTGGDVGFVAKNTQDPNGLVQAASQMQAGQFSKVIEGSDGFYIVKLIEPRQDEVRFAKLFISYKTFAQKLADLKKSGKIKEYIGVPETVDAASR